MLSVVGVASLVVRTSGNTVEDGRISIAQGASSENSRFSDANRKAIANIAQRENVGVAQIESLAADEISRARETVRRANGNLGPGAFIIPGAGGIRIDPQKTRIVPSGAIMNFDRDFFSDKKFLAANRYSSDKLIYIDPIAKDNSKLIDAKFDGYYLEGSYLKGKEYATTEKLRNVESTPTGKTGWTGIFRVYSDYPQLGRVILREADNVAGGITVHIPQSSINAKVGEYPATLTRLQDTNGKTMSAVQWLTVVGRTNSLYIRQIDDASVATMMRLAESLSRR